MRLFLVIYERRVAPGHSEFVETSRTFEERDAAMGFVEHCKRNPDRVRSPRLFEVRQLVRELSHV